MARTTTPGKIWLFIACALCFAHAADLQGALLGRDIHGRPVPQQDPTAVFEYDTVLGVTWLRNWNATDLGDGWGGRVDWSEAMAWAAQLRVGDYGGWRLPRVLDTGLPGCDLNWSGGTDCGYTVQTKEGDTVYSEMAHLWYETLGNLAICGPQSGNYICDEQPGGGLKNRGPFLNMTPSDTIGLFWTATELPTPDDTAFAIYVLSGFQGYALKHYKEPLAVAVRDGDVLSVPEPGTIAMLLAALATMAHGLRARDDRRPRRTATPG
jgi:hypothetical protein